MIPYAEFEKAITLWKLRQGGTGAGAVPQPVEGQATGPIPEDEAVVDSGLIEMDEPQK